MSSRQATRPKGNKGTATRKTRSGSSARKKQKTNIIRSLIRWTSESISSGRARIFLAVILAGVLLCVTLSMVSYLPNAQVDQHVLHPTHVEQIPPAENALGSVGVWIGDLLFNGLLGFGSFILLVYAWLIMCRMFRLIEWGFLRMFKVFALSVFWSVWIAVAASSLDRWLSPEGALRWGGELGDLMVSTLLGAINVVGLVVVLVVSLLLLLMICSQTFFEVVRDSGPTAKQMNMPSMPTIPMPQPRGWWARLRGAGDSSEGEPLEDELEDEDYAPEDDTEGDAEVEPLMPESRDDVDRELEDDTHTIQLSREDTPPFAQPTVARASEDDFDIEVAPEDKRVAVEDETPTNTKGMLLSYYRMPSIELLKDYEQGNRSHDSNEIESNKRLILATLASFKIPVTPHRATIGPTVTLYEVRPAEGVKLARIKSLEDDLALALKSVGIRIIAPMPGLGTVGIEVPNSHPQTVSMRSIIESQTFQEEKQRMELPVGIGKTITNKPFVFDLTKMPHLLIAGATGQGKSVGLNAMITSLLYSKRPEELKFVMVDPKMLEFSLYEVIERHFLAMLPDSDKAIITDMSRVVPTLNSLCIEMDNRYQLLTQAKVRNIKEYNDQVASGALKRIDGYEPLPYIVLIVDEFADLIMTSGKEVEQPIARLAQKARAAGIHMVIATQRPSTDVITGLIKANFPARIAFKVFSMVDSRTILDSPGANQLIGRGDMLFYQGKDMIRIQCAFMDTPETEAIVEHIGAQEGFPSAMMLPEYVPEGKEGGERGISAGEKDALFDDVARMIVQTGIGSTSNIQRKFNLGYNRAGRLMDQLEAAGIVSPQSGSKPREVIVRDLIQLEELLSNLR